MSDETEQRIEQTQKDRAASGVVCNLGEDVNCYACDPIGMFLRAREWSKRVNEGLNDNQLIHRTLKSKRR
jgi:hypothetical protein